jgi:predicted RNA-binding protein Jag
MKVLEVEGRTTDEATRKGLTELGIADASQVEIEVVDQGKAGFSDLAYRGRQKSGFIITKIRGRRR